MEGILLIHKPRDVTSHDVVNRVRRFTGIRRVGHAGTLDPLADGLLIVLIGDATKQQRRFMQGQKEYIATLHLGAVSDTDDAEGRIQTANSKISIPDENQIRECLKAFRGEIMQVPPSYSAVKVGGKRAYALARKGETPQLTPRRVAMAEIEMLDYRYPLLKIRVVCSPGTYVRALARDMGRALGCGSYLTALTRTRSGAFRLDAATPLQTLTGTTWREHLLPSVAITPTLDR